MLGGETPREGGQIDEVWSFYCIKVNSRLLSMYMFVHAFVYMHELSVK